MVGREMPFNFFSTIRFTFQHPRLPLFLPPLSVGSFVGEVPLFLLVKSDLLLWEGVLVGCCKQKHGCFDKRGCMEIFSAGNIFYMSGEVKLFLPSITKNPIEVGYRLAIWNLL